MLACANVPTSFHVAKTTTCADVSSAFPPHQLAGALGCFHLVCGATAAAVSARRGEAWAPRTAKVLAVGLLALLEVLLLPEQAAADGGDAGGSGGGSGR